MPTNFGTLIDQRHPIVGMKGLLDYSFETNFHVHPRGQLAYAASGIIKVNTDRGSWVIPPSQAVWIPGDIRHAVSTEREAEIRHLFIDPSCLHRFPDQCSIVEVSSLLRELILRVADFGTEYETEGKASRICAVIMDELEELKPSLLYLPGANDRRLQRVMQAMIENPQAEVGLKYWSAHVGASERTISRLFLKETGITFQQWRKQLILQEAVKRIGHGEAVTDVALELGYRSTSAFVAMFRKALGKPPAQYIREGGLA